MKIHARHLAVLLLSGLAVAGCTQTTSLPPTATTAAEGPTGFQMATDIPIPQGASLDNERSIILSDRDRWTGRLVMKTNLQPVEAAAFFQQQMPGFGWDPVMSITSTTSVLTFLRGARAATVQIEKGALWGSSVHVTVAPRQTEGGAAAGTGYGSATGASRSPVRSETLR